MLRFIGDVLFYAKGFMFTGSIPDVKLGDFTKEKIPTIWYFLNAKIVIYKMTIKARNLNVI